MRVLLAFDGSECSKLAVEEVSSSPWRKGTELKILAVAASKIPEWIIVPNFTLPAAHEAQIREHHREFEKLLPKVKESILATEHGSDLIIETEVIEGDPKNVIIDAAEQWEADLIILGSHGYGNIKRFFLGSVAQAVAAHAPCSVKIVRKRKTS
ncbi:MAG: universal stress protein [Acidobacteria bacterium]|nr:universal stress protein [Acidobacteriota bacterium]